jgi:hypothetical protein
MSKPFIVISLFFILVAIALVPGFTDNDRSMSILQKQGYTKIEMTGYKFFACSDDDLFVSGFKALSIAGKPIEGVVCSDWLKSATVRINY